MKGEIYKRNIFIPVFLFSLVMIVSNCTSGKQPNDSLGDEITKITIDPYSRPEGKLTLSEIIDSMTFIPLETNDKCLIAYVSKCIFSDNHILLYCSVARRCYLFSRTGHFITQIGDVGQGPSEYIIVSDLLQLNEQNNQIIIRNLKPNKLLYYDFEGQFIKSVSLNFDPGAFSYHNGFYLLKNINEGNTLYTYKIWDEDFNLLFQKVKPKSFVMNPPNSGVAMGTPFCQYLFNNQVHVRENMLNDTLYRIDDDFSFIPKYVINAGKYELTLEMRSNRDIFLREAKSCPTVTSIFETKDFLFLNYLLSIERYNCYYHKKEKNTLYFPSSSGIPNDHNGGFDFWPQQMVSDKEMMCAYSAERLLKLDKLKITDEKLKHVLNSLKEDSNPVIAIVTLKD
jgi:hypothetical protein